jgi:hypothetical protein
MDQELIGNKSQYQRAARVMPWGVSSNFRYWGEETPVITNARGAYIWDADGHRMIDYRLAFGPIILGHADSRVNRKVCEAIENGVLFAHTHLLEIEVAERIVRMCPGCRQGALCQFRYRGHHARTAHCTCLYQPEKVVKLKGSTTASTITCFSLPLTPRTDRLARRAARSRPRIPPASPRHCAT